MVPAKPVEGLEEKISDLLRRACEAKLRIATAESCTGGLIAAMITDVTGFSHAFERGFITYSPQSKTEQLGISSKLLEEEGAVSKSCAIAMAEGARRRSAADIALSVTGFAGPAGEDDEEGLVHFACSRRGWSIRHAEKHFGAIGRDPIRARCLETAIDLMSEML